MISDSIAFVGQAPSSRSNPYEPLSGECGKKLAQLIGVEFDAFLRAKRFNLNNTYTPKVKGKGDGFDPFVGKIVAVALNNCPQFSKYVLLGHKVCDCFGVPFLACHTWTLRSKKFFCLPHPSGVNLWWNRKSNRELAEKSLRTFITS